MERYAARVICINTAHHTVVAFATAQVYKVGKEYAPYTFTLLPFYNIHRMFYRGFIAYLHPKGTVSGKA